MIEPWDWYYESAAASRKLSPRVSLDRLTRLNREVYRSIGADPEAINVKYDLGARGRERRRWPTAPSAGGPASSTAAGRRASRGSLPPTAPAGWTTSTSCCTRPVTRSTSRPFAPGPPSADWPDSDPFTEAVAEFVALDVYEPAWQQRWLGDSVPLAEGLAGRYGGIVLDVAWALFEMRMRRDPAADPNLVLDHASPATISGSGRTRSSPGGPCAGSWWTAPGYMMNYAVGAILIADLRARTRASRAVPASGDATWYGWVAPRLYRFGLERPTRQVIEEFLGRPVSPAALLADMRRMKGEYW